MADAAAVPADASDGEQIELEDSLVAYCETHADTTPADLLRAFNVRCYLWPRLTDAERDAGAVVPDARVADCSQDELVECLASWIRLRETEAAFRQALAAAQRVVVVHGSISSNAMRALDALVPSDEERPAKRLCADAPSMAAPSMAVRTLDARGARSHGDRQLRQRGYCVLPGFVSGDLDAWIRRRHLPRELSFYPNWKSSDFFHNAESEPPIPLSGDLEPLRALLPGIEAAASGIAGGASCLQANADVVFGSDERAARRPQGRVAVFRRRPRLGVAARDGGAHFQRGARPFRRARPRGLATRRRVHAPVLRGRRGPGPRRARIF